jgi:hypothetical protein
MQATVYGRREPVFDTFSQVKPMVSTALTANRPAWLLTWAGHFQIHLQRNVRGSNGTKPQLALKPTENYFVC